MKAFYKLILICYLIAGINFVYSQQESQYTQYMYNTVSFNPAYAGSRKNLSVVGAHRSQWVGFNGAPHTQTLSLHKPLGYNEKIGLGISLSNEKIGSLKEAYFNIDFSYNIKISYFGTLSFGLKAGLNMLNVDYNELTIFDETDPLLDLDIDKKFTPTTGIGIYYYTDVFYLGFSAPNLLRNKRFSKNSLASENVSNSILAFTSVNYYLISGYVFELDRFLKFKPSVLLKMVLGAPVQVDVSANFLMQNKLTLGFAYRLNSTSISALAGFQVNDNIFLGIAYDQETSQLSRAEYANGTYELTLRFEPIKRHKRFLTPRFF